MREGSTVVQQCDCQEAQVVSVCGRQTQVVLSLSTKIPPFTVIRCVSNWALTQFGLWWLFRHPSAQYFLTLGFLAGRCVTGPGFCVLPPVALRFEFLDQPTHSHTAAQWRWDFHEGIAFFYVSWQQLTHSDEQQQRTVEQAPLFVWTHSSLPLCEWERHPQTLLGTARG